MNRRSDEQTARCTTSCEEAPRSLAVLALSQEELRALARQGFVAVEYRGHRGPFYKLRFRVDGRQAVKYLGQDVRFAARIRHELASLQARRRHVLELRRMSAEARKLLRETKRDLSGQFKEAGFTFHGLEIRTTISGRL
jgi:hypothetical protein